MLVIAFLRSVITKREIGRRAILFSLAGAPRQPLTSITLDIDWAPDVAIDHTVNLLDQYGASATWFVTHDSPSIRRLATHHRMELAIHPNFLAKSSHGDTPEKVMAHMLAMVPGAVGMRTHGLFQSSPLLEWAAREKRIQYDASIFLPGHQNLRPVVMRFESSALIRMPYCWEDANQLNRPPPCGAPLNGILSFHPTLVYLNSSDKESYKALKARHAQLQDVDKMSAQPFVNSGRGVGTIFEDVLSQAGKFDLLRDVARNITGTSESTT